jgi:hypothetical protein
MRLTPENPLAARGGTITAWLAVLVLAGVVALAWLGYRAASEWQSNAAQLIERRQQQVATALSLNLARDMRAVQISVVDRHEWGSEELESPQHLARVLAPVFERYAYPEVFFASRLPLDPDFVSRAARPPSWAAPGDEAAGVRWFKNADVADRLAARLMREVRSGRQYSIIRLDIGGTEYQVVTRFLRGTSADAYPAAVLGFMVNMDWARTHYFVPMIEAVMDGTADIIETQIVDPGGSSSRCSIRTAMRLAAVPRFPSISARRGGG